MDGWERPDNAHAEAVWLVPSHTGTITSNWHKGPGNTQVEEGCVIPVAVTENQRGEVWTTPHVNQLTTGGGKPGQGYPAVLTPAYPLATRGRDDGAEVVVPPIPASFGGGGMGHNKDGLVALTPDLAVRRLTPTECERLMSWPDGWTRYRADGTEIADSHRYRLCGNGVVSNCSEWIGRRLIAAIGDGEAS